MKYKVSSQTRLRSRKAFRYVYEEGAFVANRMLALHYLPRPEIRHRIGFTAGKRLGNAVKRNRCKRRLKELYRLNQHQMPEGVDMVVVARKAMVKCDWEQLVDAFCDALRRIKLKKSFN